jgi:hypothetical protein
MIAHAGGTDESLAIVMLFAAIWTGWIGWTRLHGNGFPRVPLAGAYALLGLAGVLVVTSAFVPRALLGPKTAATATTRPVSTATIAFLRPREHERVSGPEMNVVLDLEGGTIVQATTTSIAPDTGHVHLLLDGALVSMTFGTEQVVDLSHVPAGPHTLTAEFVAADHLPFAPPVMATVDFVKAPGS